MTISGVLIAVATVVVVAVVVVVVGSILEILPTSQRKTSEADQKYLPITANPQRLYIYFHIYISIYFFFAFVQVLVVCCPLAFRFGLSFWLADFNFAMSHDKSLR